MSILMPRLVHAWNKFAKAKESLSESPATIARRFYYDELVFEPRAVRFLVETFGQTQIVLGTDYPFAAATGRRLTRSSSGLKTCSRGGATRGGAS